MNKLQKAVLQAVDELGVNAYGVPIRERVDKILGRRWWPFSVSYGALFVALEQLERKGLLTSITMPGGAERGYRDKRYYYLTVEGMEARR